MPHERGVLLVIYYQGRSLFIHIPRTSGVSLTKAVMTQPDPESTQANVSLGSDRHKTAHQLRPRFEDWEQLEKFTIIRNPWRLCESTYRNLHRKLPSIESGETWAREELKTWIREACGKEFSEFVVWHYQFLRQGFFDHWALEWETHKDLGVKAFRFEELDWQEVCRLMQLPRHTVRPHENAAMDFDVEWTEEATEFIRQRCRLDFELFGYPREP